MEISREEVMEMDSPQYLPDRIPGTAKTRTYCANPDLFFYEDTLDEWLESHRRLLKK